jgi:hypothetical protein
MYLGIENPFPVSFTISPDIQYLNLWHLQLEIIAIRKELVSALKEFGI